jgi:hypothetical protein
MAATRARHDGLYLASQLTTGGWDKARQHVERQPEQYDAGIRDQFDNLSSFNIAGGWRLCIVS